MKEIKLTQNKIALIDDADFELINSHNWIAHFTNGGLWYATTHIGDNKYIKMHQMIIGKSEGFEIDHINGNGLDNRRVNLRHATVSQNRANSKNRKHSSKYRGVCWVSDRGKWLAQIKVDSKNIYLGIFLDEEQAARTYDEAALKAFGEFATLNFPNEEKGGE